MLFPSEYCRWPSYFWLGYCRASLYSWCPDSFSPDRMRVKLLLGYLLDLVLSKALFPEALAPHSSLIVSVYLCLKTIAVLIFSMLFGEERGKRLAGIPVIIFSSYCYFSGFKLLNHSFSNRCSRYPHFIIIISLPLPRLHLVSSLSCHSPYTSISNYTNSSWMSSFFSRWQWMRAYLGYDICGAVDWLSAIGGSCRTLEARR